MITEAMLMDEVESRYPRGFGGRMYGAYPAVVKDVVDPDGQGRVKVEFPWSPDTGSGTLQLWARIATMMAGNNRGTWFIPDPEDEVLVVFLGGDPSKPCVVGALWNGSDAPPESMDSAGKNEKKVIRSRNGVRVTLDDKDGQEKFVVETPGGQKLSLKDGPANIRIEDVNGNSLEFAASGVTLNVASKLSVTASTIDVSAGMVTVNAGMSSFSGVVKSDTVITNSVISASYTPGAGNIW
jgi:uncharacterized protein involved in type VI secretion and phage assembly